MTQKYVPRGLLLLPFFLLRVTASEISGTTDRLYGFATWCIGVGETKTTQKTDRDCDFPGTVGNRNEALPR